MAQEQTTDTMVRLPASTRVGGVALTVADLGRSLAFYQDVLGYTTHKVSSDSVWLSAGSEHADFILHERPGAMPKPRRTSGLFHAAILLPSRRDLARIVQQLAAQGWPIGGASDHGVSEALYLDDPDGNGLEIYTDRPRESWPRSGEQVAMTTEPLDFDSLMGELGETEPGWMGIPDGTTIGHIHLQVSNLEDSARFYTDILGFETMQDTYPDALFVAAGGYHHHIGMNVWAGPGVPPQPENSAGLTRFTVEVPDRPSWDQLLYRLAGADEPIERLNETAAVVADPNGIEIMLRGV
ncbi:catechol 2,3-dioxygenase [soil metagenome]